MRVDFNLVDEQVFTLLKSYMTKLDPSLTSKNFSTVENNYSSTTTFPFIYIHRLPSIELATDLERQDFNGALLTYEIIVTSNDSQNKAKKTMNQVTAAMKSMRFSGTSLPLTSSSNNLHIVTARWERRLYGADIL